MDALTYGYQTQIPTAFYVTPHLKFNAHEKRVKGVTDDLILSRSGDPSRNIATLVRALQAQTHISDKTFESRLSQIVRTLGTLERPLAEGLWNGFPTRADYFHISENYNIAEVEEAHFKASGSYGW